jgi:hypothetical protein
MQKNVTATNEVIKEQAKVLGHHMTEKNFVHKNSYAFYSKNKIILKMLQQKLLHSSVSFTLKILTTVFLTPYHT